jgi:16S rRNA (guanine527-N7)-methyltransferase
LNLTGAVTPREVVNPHLLDVCLAIAKVSIPEGATLIDVGSGSGLPGIPLKLLRPDIEITLVETSQKKVAFLEHVRGVLGIKDIRIECARAEMLGRKACWRERFDIAITQATAALNTAAELILPFVTVGGTGVFLKGANIDTEISPAVPVINALGGQIESSHRHLLPTTTKSRTIVVIRKVRPTPADFPRSARAVGRSPGAHKGTRRSAAE